MVLTQVELDEILRRNPALKVHGLDISLQKQNPSRKKHNKYRNKRVYVFEDGYTSLEKDEIGHGKAISVFDSVKEYQRHIALCRMERKGTIKNLQRQVQLEIQPAFEYHGKKVRAIRYCADFVYEVTESGRTIVEDVKGIDKKTGKVLTTEAFQLKWKLLKYRYPDYNFQIF